jgi:tetratricopeptide (TPR) repeat protein
MKKRFILLLLFFCTLGPRSILAKAWDPRLSQAIEMSFAGQPGTAEVLMEEYRREYPEDPNGLIFLSIVREWKAGLGPESHEHLRDDNRKLLQQAVELAEKNRQAHPRQMDALINLGNSYFFLARNFAEQGKAMKAGTTGKKLEGPMQEALQQDPSRVDAYLALGAFHYFAGNTPKFWAPFKKLLGIHGNKGQGLKELHQALQGQHPFLWQTRYALLEIYSSGEKNSEKALAQLVSFEEAFPRNPVIPLKKAYIYEMEQPEQAVKTYLHLAEQCGRQYTPCPKKFSYYALSQAGWLALKRGDFATAKGLLQKSLAFDPGDYPKRTAQIKKWQKTAEKRQK